MMRQRRNHPEEEEEESSDDEDAFSKLSSRKGKKDKKNAPMASAVNSSQPPGSNESKQGTQNLDNNQDGKEGAPQQQKQLPVSTTSSMKRHHVVSNNQSRKAKMDALLQELEAEKSRRPVSQDRRAFVPEKKGSFVDPSEEHLTTNLFVGNLAPSITEEELTDLFRQFGDLYSVKIMWPRTEEERRRGRNTGFVCFMKREDAEDAIQQCDETDPFNVGRRIMMRWGKQVKKIIKRGTGGVPVAPIRKREANIAGMEDRNNEPSKRVRAGSTGNSGIAGNNQSAFHEINQSSLPVPHLDPFSAVPVFDPEKDGEKAVRVQIPEPPARAHFIAIVANFVSKDGTLLERKLIEMEAGNPDFSFLTMPPEATQAGHLGDNQKQTQIMEHIFYRWRVYAFCQGDGYNAWRTEPFMMIRPNGNFWIPPMLNQQAAWREEQERKIREENIERQKKQRRRRVMTGRQLEQARGRGLDGGSQLTTEEIHHFNSLTRKKLCASRDSICEAMAFCFEKSGAAKHISSLLKEILLEDEKGHPGISVETRIARLYLLSDILFNSQQPGVRNAFRYRDSIEQMAPEVFTSLGKHGKGTIGRMTRNKLSTAVSAVLGAWTNWSVYNPTFLDELHARFLGKEIKKEASDETKQKDQQEKPVEEDENATAVKVITEQQRGDWTEVSHDHDEVIKDLDDKNAEACRGTAPRKEGEEVRGGSNTGSNDADDDGLDGEALEEEDLDGEALEEEDLDGEALDEDDLDAEALNEDDVETD